jgi:hypothetical protein
MSHLSPASINPTITSNTACPEQGRPHRLQNGRRTGAAFRQGLVRSRFLALGAAVRSRSHARRGGDAAGGAPWRHCGSRRVGRVWRAELHTSRVRYRDRARSGVSAELIPATERPRLPMSAEGPVAQIITSLTAPRRAALAEAVRRAYLANRPDGARSFAATAWACRGTVP